MRDEVGLVNRQHAAKIPKIVKLPQIFKRRAFVTAHVYRERRFVPVHAEKHDILVFYVVVDQFPFEQDGVKRLTIGQAFVAPDWSKKAFRAENGVGEPPRIFPQVPGAVNVSTGKYILIIHSGDRSCLSAHKTNRHDTKVYRNSLPIIRLPSI